MAGRRNGLFTVVAAAVMVVGVALPALAQHRGHGMPGGGNPGNHQGGMPGGMPGGGMQPGNHPGGGMPGGMQPGNHPGGGMPGGGQWQGHQQEKCWFDTGQFSMYGADSHAPLRKCWR